MYHRKLLLTVCILCIGLCSFSGCDTTPAERVDVVKQIVSQAAAISQTVDVAIGDLEKIIADTQAALQDPNIPPDMKPELEKVLASASVRLAKLKSEKQKATAIIARWQTFLEQVDPNSLTPEQELQLYATGTGEAAKFLPQPYRGYVYLGMLLVPLVGSVLKNINQRNQINESKKKTTEIIISVDKLLESDHITNAKAAKSVLQDNQSGATQDAVDAIHDPMKNTAPTK